MRLSASIGSTSLTGACILNMTPASHLAMAVQRETISYKVAKAIQAMHITLNWRTPQVSFEQTCMNMS